MTYETGRSDVKSLISVSKYLISILIKNQFNNNDFTELDIGIYLFNNRYTVGFI